MSSAPPPPPGPGMSSGQPYGSTPSASSYGQAAPSYGQAPGYGSTPSPAGSTSSAAYTQPPEKKNGWLKWALIGLAALLALCCCGGGGLFWFVKKQTDAPKQSVETFMEAVADKDAAEACSVMDPSKFSGGSGCETELQSDLDGANGNQYDAGTLSMPSSTINGDTATVEASYRRDGQPKSATFTLAKIDGDWKITDIKDH